MRFSWRKFALLSLALALLLSVDAWVGFRIGWPMALALLVTGITAAGAAGWGAAAFFRDKNPAASPVPLPLPEKDPAPAAAVGEEDADRVQALLELTRSLALASADLLDERELMNSALSVITGLTGALGCSFVPVDEWHQTLPAFTYGQLPAPVLRAWSAHLADGMLRERCGACEVLHSAPGGCPLHPPQIGASLTVTCLPMNTAGEQAAAARPDRALGVLHLYLPAARTLDEGLRGFINALLPQIAVAYEAARIRSQEVTTMRQLRMLRAPENETSASLTGLVAGLSKALGVDFVVLRLRPSSDERLSNLTILHGSLPPAGEHKEGAIQKNQDDAILKIKDGSILKVLNGAMDAVLRGETRTSLPETLPAWIAFPLPLPDGSALSDAPGENSIAGGRVLGMLVVGSNRPFTFHPRQRVIMQTVAAQAALLVENDRMLHSLEYKVVIEERARLAREIHDGLAQTLAFLKLQAAQMQTYLAQGDTARLSAVLKDNYQALAEAYLDTRQAIDNLRLTPQEGLETWIERILREFENSSGLRVERDLVPLEHQPAPEVQAHLMRILQESLSNVRKHSRASYARVSMRAWSGEIILEVADNGLGFDAGDVPEESRHGLRGMRERAEMIGADFQIISHPHHGTTVRLVLPDWLEEQTSS